MRQGRDSYRGNITELDGSRARRNLAPIEIVQLAGLGVFGLGCTLEAVHRGTGIPRREIVNILYKQAPNIARWAFSKKFRQDMRSRKSIL